HQLPERIATVRVKTSRDDDQIRSETRRHFIKRGFKPALVFGSRRGRAQGQVQRVTQTASGSLLAARPGSGIPRILMRREKVNARIVVKDSLRAVAVMDVPIDDRDAFDLGVVLLRVTRRK